MVSFVIIAQSPIKKKLFIRCQLRFNFCSFNPALARITGEGLLRINQSLLQKLSSRLIINLILVGIYLFFAIYLNSFDPADWSYPFKESMRIIPIEQRENGIKIDQTVSKKPIIIQKATYSSGIGLITPSQLKLKLSKKASKLSGKCGLPDNAKGSEISCLVRTGAHPIFTSQKINSNHPIEFFNVTLEGTEIVFLEIRSLKPEQRSVEAVWVDLKLE